MKYVALLRGINVGGNNKVDMKLLKACFEEAGYRSVGTYINSGNVLFESDLLESGQLSRDIEDAIEKRFGLAIKVVVLDEKRLRYVADRVPLEWTHDSLEKRCEVLFLWPDIDKESVLDDIFQTEVDTLVYYPGVVVWRMDRQDYSKSGLHKLIGSAVYKQSTIRNINTVRKLVQLLD